MAKKPYVLGVVSFLLIPTVVFLGATLANSINPEIAAGHANYERNYRLLNLAKSLSFWTTGLMSMALWFLTGFFLLKAKKQSYRWLPWAVLGPLGFIVLTILRDNAPTPWDLYQQFIRRLNLVLRVAYELSFFAAVWVIAYQTVVLKRNLLIRYQAASTGTSVGQIISQQNASSGMWAFSEGLEEWYLVVFLYLLWPICLNVVGHLPKLWASSPET
jgi:hypothetical protein